MRIIVSLLLFATAKPTWAAVPDDVGWPRLLVERSTSNTIKFKYFKGAGDYELLGGQEFKLTDLELLARVHPRILSAHWENSQPLSQTEASAMLYASLTLTYVLGKDIWHESLGPQEWLLVGMLLIASMAVTVIQDHGNSAVILDQRTIAQAIKPGVKPKSLDGFVRELRTALTHVAQDRYARCFSALL